MTHELIAQSPGLSPYLPLIAALAAMLVAAARYVVIAGGALAIVTAFRERLAPLRIQDIPFTRTQLWREFGHSMSTVIIFGVIAGLTVVATDGASLRLPEQPETLGEWMRAMALVPVLLLLHDFYFYWLHRFMHLSWVYPHVHRVHHQSTNPSPLASLAFHPLEALLEAADVIAMIALIAPPLPTLIVFGFLAFAHNVLSHLGYELVPQKIRASRIGRWLNTSTRHSHHHRTFRTDFGLYTLIWDRLFGTVSRRDESWNRRIGNPCLSAR